MPQLTGFTRQLLTTLEKTLNDQAIAYDLPAAFGIKQPAPDTEYGLVFRRPDGSEEQVSETLPRTVHDLRDVLDMFALQYASLATRRLSAPKRGRNEPCNCGSGRKSKRCCG